MSLCASCGLQLMGDEALCPHHHARWDNWAASNRAWCDFFHRGIAMPRVSDPERHDVSPVSV